MGEEKCSYCSALLDNPDNKFCCIYAEVEVLEEIIEAYEQVVMHRNKGTISDYCEEMMGRYISTLTGKFEVWQKLRDALKKLKEI